MHNEHLQPYWQATFEQDGVKVTVRSRHSNRTRIPRGHEISRQIVRGTYPQMVKEQTYEWEARCCNRLYVIRPNPNGTFSVGGFWHKTYPTVEAACLGLAGIQASKRQ